MVGKIGGVDMEIVLEADDEPMTPRVYTLLSRCLHAAEAAIERTNKEFFDEWAAGQWRAEHAGGNKVSCHTSSVVAEMSEKERDWDRIWPHEVTFECETCGKRLTLSLKEFCEESGWEPGDSRLDMGVLFGECEECQQ